MVTEKFENKGTILRGLVNGMILGASFILPGISSSVLATILGIYERLIATLASLRKSLLSNLNFLLPLMIGGAVGLLTCAFLMGRLFEHYEALILWFFIGCSFGFLPKLWQDAGKQGRALKDLVGGVCSLLVSILFSVVALRGATIQLHSWLLVGAIIGVTLLVPGLSSSTILVYLGVYRLLIDGIKTLDLMVLFPAFIGCLLALLILSKGINFLLKHQYSLFYHGILGLVLGSTVMIIPFEFLTVSIGVKVVYVGLLLLGVLIGRTLSRLGNVCV